MLDNYDVNIPICCCFSWIIMMLAVNMINSG